MRQKEVFRIFQKVESIADDMFSNVCFLLTIAQLAESREGMQSIAYLARNHAKTAVDTLNALLAIAASARALLPRNQLRPNTEQSLLADGQLLAALLNSSIPSWL